MFGNGNKLDNGERFAGTWRAITARCCMDFTITKKNPNKPDDHEYSLACAGHPTLTMLYNSATQMLENHPDQQPRRIAFWDRGNGKKSLFALRRKSGTSDTDVLLPFEADDGAWGADKG